MFISFFSQLMFLDTLNTNQFEPSSLAAFENVFKRRPKVYSYSLSCKEIPREEDMLENNDEEQTERSLSEVSRA